MSPGPSGAFLLLLYLIHGLDSAALLRKIMLIVEEFQPVSPRVLSLVEKISKRKFKKITLTPLNLVPKKPCWS